MNFEQLVIAREAITDKHGAENSVKTFRTL
jgi:hypothetical protein